MVRETRSTPRSPPHPHPCPGVGRHRSHLPHLGFCLCPCPGPCISLCPYRWPCECLFLWPAHTPVPAHAWSGPRASRCSRPCPCPCSIPSPHQGQPHAVAPPNAPVVPDPVPSFVSECKHWQPTVVVFCAMPLVRLTKIRTKVAPLVFWHHKYPFYHQPIQMSGTSRHSTRMVAAAALISRLATSAPLPPHLNLLKVRA